MKKLVTLSLLSLIVLASCSNKESVSSSTVPSFNPNASLVDQNIDDNYRNYYEIFVSSFADSNGDGTGDLNGIDAKLSYLRDLGYTGIWLTPIFTSSSYHKYNCDNYFAIDSSFGTMDDLKKLVKDAHDLGIKVILDGVFNHSGVSNDWFTKALLAKQKEIAGTTMSDEEKNYASLYVFYDTVEEANASGMTYYQAGANDFYYEANFSSSMPEFNFDSEFTYTKIKSIIDYYMSSEIGIDGFRLDAVKYYYYGNTTKNVAALSRIEKMVKDNDADGYAVGECWDSDSIISSYYQSDLDSYFYFPASTSAGFIFGSMGGFDGSEKNCYLENQKNMITAANGHIPAPFLDNHDMARMTKGNNIMMTKFQLGLLSMLTGTTYNYYGDEIGMSSSNAPGGDNNDSNFRTHYYWDDDTHASECYDPQYSVTQEEFYPASAAQLKDPDSILNYVKTANLIRNSLPSIARGYVEENDTTDQTINNDTSNPLLVVNKEYNNSSIKILINFSLTVTTTYTSSLTPKAILPLSSSSPITYQDGVITLPPYAIAVLA
jgi:alpha-amylase